MAKASRIVGIDFGSSVDPAMMAAFLARGGQVTRVAPDTARSYSNLEWRALVRGESLEIEDMPQGFRPSAGFIKLGQEIRS